MKLQFFLCFLLALCAGRTSFAQESLAKETRAQKPLLFELLPSKSHCSRTELEKIVHSGRSRSISLKLNNDLELSGEVLENLTTSTGIQNINVRLSNFGDALLHISIIKRPGRPDKMIGRIVHPDHGDALTISEENGRFYITKHKRQFFMVE